MEIGRYASVDSKNSAKTSDGGFYESNSGQNSVSTSGTSTPDKESSRNCCMTHYQWFISDESVQMSHAGHIF